MASYTFVLSGPILPLGSYILARQSEDSCKPGVCSLCATICRHDSERVVDQQLRPIIANIPNLQFTSAITACHLPPAPALIRQFDTMHHLRLISARAKCLQARSQSSDSFLYRHTDLRKTVLQSPSAPVTFMSDLLLSERFLSVLTNPSSNVRRFTPSLRIMSYMLST